MLFIRCYLVFAALVPWSCCAPSKEQIPLREKSPTPFTQDFDQDVIQLMSEWHVPGLSIAVVSSNETFSKVRICQSQQPLNQQ